MYIINLPQKKEELLQKIKELNEKESVGPHSEQPRKERAGAKQDFQELAIREEINWRQNSRINWLRNEDNNTKNFILC